LSRMSLLVPVFTADQNGVASGFTSPNASPRAARSDRMSETRNVASRPIARRAIAPRAAAPCIAARRAAARGVPRPPAGASSRRSVIGLQRPPLASAR
jgi:hypothetical protein